MAWARLEDHGFNSCPLQQYFALFECDRIGEQPGMNCNNAAGSLITDGSVAEDRPGHVRQWTSGQGWWPGGIITIHTTILSNGAILTHIQDPWYDLEICGLAPLTVLLCGGLLGRISQRNSDL